jgi:hypothetical protein
MRIGNVYDTPGYYTLVIDKKPEYIVVLAIQRVENNGPISGTAISWQPTASAVKLYPEQQQFLSAYKVIDFIPFAEFSYVFEDIRIKGVIDELDN